MRGALSQLREDYLQEKERGTQWFVVLTFQQNGKRFKLPQCDDTTTLVLFQWV